MILRNPIYISKIIVPAYLDEKETLIEGIRESIISERHCSKCDSKMTGSPSRSSNGAQYLYYHGNHCKKEYYNLQLVNNTFESILNDFVFTKNSKTLCKELMQFLNIEKNSKAKKTISSS